MTTIDPHAAYRHLFRESNDGLLLVDPDKKQIIDANPTMQRLTGYRKKQLLQLDLAELIQGDDLDSSLRLTQACESTCFFHSQEGYLLNCLEGEPLAVSVSASRIHGDEATVSLVTVRDISERIRSQKLLSMRQSQLAHASRLSTVGELSAAIVHEITQPITAILSYTEAGATLLQEGTAGEQSNAVVGYLHEIHAAAQRATGIIQRIRSFVRMTAPSRSECVLPEIVSEAIAFVGPESERLGVKIDLDVPETEERYHVHVDRIQIQQVLVNLLKNACDSIDEAGGEAQVRVKVTSTPALFQVDVEDNGAGFEERGADRLFEPFYSTRPHGVGIGLAICQTIIEAHGGEIWAQPNTEHGATLSFTVPKREVLRS